MRVHHYNSYMSKFTESGWTQLRLDSGTIFKIGDYVQSGRSKGFITGVALDGDVLLDTGKVFFVLKLHHAEPNPLLLPYHKEEEQPYEDPMEKIARLEKELAECNAIRQLPAVVENAPMEVKPALPEVRTNHILEEIQEASVILTEKLQTGTKQEVRAVEKQIAHRFEELKETAPQTTICASADCRVQFSTANNRQTIRIYFTKKPSDTQIKDMGRYGFRAFTERKDGKKEYYWGAFLDDKKLSFAKNLCKQDLENTTENTTIPKAKETHVLPEVKTRKITTVPKEILPMNRETLIPLPPQASRQQEAIEANEIDAGETNTESDPELQEFIATLRTALQNAGLQKAA